MQMWILWLILLIVFVIVEAATLGLATIWFAVGAGVAMVMDLLGASVTAQIITMLAVSAVCFVICFIWIKPIIDRRGRGATPTNADRVIGQEGIVIKDLDAIEGKGQVKVMGQVWSAKADKTISEGTRVRVISMEGVKLKVEEIN